MLEVDDDAGTEGGEVVVIVVWKRWWRLAELEKRWHGGDGE